MSNPVFFWPYYANDGRGWLFTFPDSGRAMETSILQLDHLPRATLARADFDRRSDYTKTIPWELFQ